MTITETQKAAFEVVFNLIGYRCQSIFISGGAVVDFDKASDVDVYIGLNKEKVAHNFLCKLPVKFESKDTHYPQAPLGQGYLPAVGKIVQVMVVDTVGNIGEAHAHAVMNGFDISTHQWAYTSKGLLIKGHQATEAYETPQILDFRARTFERYVKICQRYGHPVDMSVLEPYAIMEPHADPLKVDSVDSPTPFAMLEAEYLKNVFTKPHQWSSYKTEQTKNKHGDLFYAVDNDPNADPF